MRMGFNAFAIIIIAVLVLHAVAAVIVLAVVLTRKNRRSQQVTTGAAVEEKHAVVTGSAGYNVSGTAKYLVVFRTDAGERREFAVGAETFARLYEGQRGLLTCRGTLFVSFVPND